MIEYKPSEPIYISKDMPFMISKEDFPKFPKDSKGKTLFLGDVILIIHNGHIGAIRLMQYTGHDSWIVGIEGGGGCFLLPESQFNVVKLSESSLALLDKIQ